MVPEQLLHFTKEPIKVLDQGEILLIDVMGDDQAVVDAARISYGEGAKRVSEDRTLIRYLLRHGHTSPFEMCEIKLRIKVPMDCWRQFVRHRTASLNEKSSRYSEVTDANQMTLPGEWRLQATDNKQGSAGFLTDWPESPEGLVWIQTRAHAGEKPGAFLSRMEKEFQIQARRIYRERLNLGIAREQARKDLPLSTYTEAIWKCDLHNLLHFLSLRMDSHAQKEIRDFANAISEIVKLWVPLTWQAFNDYDIRRNALVFSRMELQGIKCAFESLLWSNTGNLKAADAKAIAVRESGLTGREAKEFETKLQSLLGA